ncbi:MAG: ATP-binding cassette domain-containing protein, partial [Candidatus Rokubacteria bacterium]|nr:ATP-binding cassette domain-containing protein [Candidatus Rokubacteria bacterium]
MLEIEDLFVSYGAIQALSGVSLSIGEGNIVTLIGANGAGKTTLLRTISGLLRPGSGRIAFEGREITGRAAEDVVRLGISHGSGRIAFDGREITGRAAEDVVRLGISHAPEGRQNFAALTVRDNLLIGAYPVYRRHGKAGVQADQERVFTLFPILRQRQRQMAGTLSGGGQQMLAIGRVLMARPRLVLLDEPSMGLAPLVVREILKQI